VRALAVHRQPTTNSEVAPKLSVGTLNRAAGAILVSLALAVLFVFASGSGSGAVSGRLGGDYPEFYAAGKLVNEGHADRLYDLDAQATAQAPYIGRDGGLLAFGYPPHVAWAYGLLARLPYRLSWLVHTALMALAAAASIVLLQPFLRRLHGFMLPLVACALTFLPLAVGFMLGQNTALTMLILCAAARLFHERHELSAGLVLGLLLYKPQLAAPLLLLLFAALSWRAVVGVAITAMATWCANATLLGTNWVGDWVHGLSSFGEADAASNSHNAVNLVGAVEACFGHTSLVIVVASVAAAAIACIAWRRRSSDMARALAIAVPASLLLAPHVLYYDAGLLVITGLVLLDRVPSWRFAVLGAWAFGLAHFLAPSIGWDPLVLLVVAALAAAIRMPASRADVSSAAPRPVPVESG
jgi:hypothetical protein